MTQNNLCRILNKINESYYDKKIRIYCNGFTIDVAENQIFYDRDGGIVCIARRLDKKGLDNSDTYISIADIIAIKVNYVR